MKFSFDFQFYFKTISFILIVLPTHVLSIDVYNAIGRYPSILNWWAGSEVSFFFNVSSLSPLRPLEGDSNNSLDSSFFADLESYRRDYEDSYGDLIGFLGSAENKITVISSNPIATYRMMRRIVHTLPDLLTSLRKYNAELVKAFPTHWWPKLDDIQDSMLGILRLHHVYNFNITEFSDGIILGRPTGTRLYGIHCYEIGLHAFTQKFHTLAIEWLKLAKIKASLDNTVDKALINTALINTVSQHDQLFEKRWVRDPYFYDRKLSPIFNTKEMPKRNRDILVETYKGRKEMDYNDINYWTLCSEGSLQTEEKKSKLFCWYERKSHSAWFINPLKMEMLSLDPDVVQIYDILGEKRIAKIKEISEGRLVISNVVDNDASAPGATKLSWVRTSVGAWISEDKDPLLKSIPLEIEQMTGLQVVKSTSSEMLQVGSYTFGGHYEVHLDVLMRESQYGVEKGDRVATFMFYLNDVDLGGRTAFAQARTVAEPHKGSAVFWYNVHRDGETDYHTYHGACPVILGSKWVANKWIRIRDQLLTHTCSRKSSKERFRVAANGRYWS